MSESGREKPCQEADIVFGRRPVAAALEEGRALKVWILRGAAGPAVADIVRRAREGRIVFQWVDHRRLEELAPKAAHQGVAARVSAHTYKTLDDLWDLGQPSPLLVLDGITDPHNLGAIVRNAAFFGAGGVIIPRWRSAGITGVVEKASAGTLGLVPLVQVPSAAHTLLELKQRGYWIYGADAAGQSAARVSFGEPTALVIGAEGEGLHRLVRERCDALVSVPGAGRVASLNASCACAALLYELFRGRAPLVP